MTTLEEARIPWLPHFVRHYLGQGIEHFLITIQCALGQRAQGEKARRRAIRALRPFGIREVGLLERDFDAMALRDHHDEIQKNSSARWFVWADLDEFQVYPRPLPELVDEWDREGAVACRGFFVDRIARSGELITFDESRPVWGQFPVGASVTRDIVGGQIEKVVCSRAAIRIAHGNHRAMPGQTLKWAAQTIAIHHFKWDRSLSDRLEIRLTDAWKARCYWWTQTARLRRVLDFNGGRIPLEAVARFDFKDDALPLVAEPYRSSARYREWERTGRDRIWGTLNG